MRAHRRLTIAVTLAPILLAVAAVQCSSESVAPGIDASTLDAAVIEAAPDAAADAPLDERSDSFSPYDGGQAYVPPLYGRCDGHAWQEPTGDGGFATAEDCAFGPTRGCTSRTRPRPRCGAGTVRRGRK